MRIGILGAGCIGLYVGGRIHAGGAGKHEVVFVGRQRYADTLKAHGLRLSSYRAAAGSGADETVIPFKELTFETDAKALADHKCDAVIVTVKCEGTAGLGDALKALPAHVAIVSLQNGIHNANALAALLPGHNVLAGMVGFNVADLGDGRISNTISGKLAFDARVGPDFAAALRLAGPVQLLSGADMQRVLYGKLLLNLANGINALSGTPTRDMLMDKRYRYVFAAAQDEALRVYAAAGIEPISGLALPIPQHWVPHILRWPNALYAKAAAASLRMDARARSSMLQDLDARRPHTEVDQLNGEIVALGQRVGVAAPVNALIVALIHAAEATGNGSPKLSGAELLERTRAVYPAVGRSANRKQLAWVCAVALLLLVLVLWRRR